MQNLLKSEERRKRACPKSSEGNQVLNTAKKSPKNKGGHGEQVDKPIFLMTVQNLLGCFVLLGFF